MKTLHEYFVYIATNPNRKALYIGVANDVAARLVEHYANRGKQNSFAGKYYCYCLIYLESYQYVNDAIAREKELKVWLREKKDALIDSFNPQRKFLNAEWCGECPPQYIWKDYYESLRNSKEE